MFTKALILVLLGSSLVLASPLNLGFDIENQQSLKDKLIGGLNNIKDKTQEWYQNAKKPFDEAVAEVFAEIKKGTTHIVELSKEKYAELKEKYEEIKEKSKVKLAESQKKLDAIIEQLKHKGGDAIAFGKVKYQELKDKAVKTYKEEKAKVEAQLDEWKQKVKEYVETAKDKIQG